MAILSSLLLFRRRENSSLTLSLLPLALVLRVNHENKARTTKTKTHNARAPFYIHCAVKNLLSLAPGIRRVITDL